MILFQVSVGCLHLLHPAPQHLATAGHQAQLVPWPQQPNARGLPHLCHPGLGQCPLCQLLSGQDMGQGGAGAVSVVGTHHVVSILFLLTSGHHGTIGHQQEVQRQFHSRSSTSIIQTHLRCFSRCLPILFMDDCHRAVYIFLLRTSIHTSRKYWWLLNI